jgi:hypothetical protein
MVSARLDGQQGHAIAAVAKQSESQFHIATLDVTALVQGH